MISASWRKALEFVTVDLKGNFLAPGSSGLFAGNQAMLDRANNKQ